MSWPMVKLGDIAIHIRNGASIKQNESSDILPISRIQTIDNRQVNFDKCGYADLGPEDYKEYRLASGDILISHINSEKHLGKCAIFESDRDDLVHGMNLLCMRPKDTAFPKFVFYYLSSELFLSKIPNITKKSVNQASFTVTSFKELEIPLPPIAEQKRIAAILDKADAIRRKRQQAIQLADDFLRAVFLEMFGDPVTNPKGWEVAGFQHYCELNPKNPKLNEDLEVSFVPMQRVSEQSPLIDISDVKTYAEVKKGFTAFAEGDVLFAKITPCMENGKAGIARELRNGYGYGSTEFHVLRPYKSHYAEFLYCLIHLEIFRKQAAGSFSGAVGHKRVPKDFFVKFALYKIPEDLLLKFSKIFIETYSCISLCGDSFLEMHALFNSLSQKAFSGQL